MTAPLYLTRLTFAEGRYTDHLLDDFVRVHHLVCAGLRADRAGAGALHHTDPASRQILVQSVRYPDWNHPDVMALARTTQAEVKDIAAYHGRVRDGDKLALRLMAVPQLAIPGSGGRKRPVTDHHEALRWLEWRLREAARPIEADASLQSVRSAKPTAHDPYRIQTSRTRIALTPVDYRGIVEVTDADRLRQISRDGIGPGKAFGFGLLRFARH